MNLSTVFLGNSTVNTSINSVSATVQNSTAAVVTNSLGFQAGANVVANLTAVAVQNSTVNTIALVSGVTTQNSTAAVVLNSTGLASGANVVANLTAFAVQNSTVNTVITITTITQQNSTAAAVSNSTGFFAGANVAMNLTQVSVGPNNFINLSSMFLGNTGNTLINSTGIFIGANVVCNLTTMFVGDGSANTVQNSSGFYRNGSLIGGGSSPGGSDTFVQFNDATTFGGTAGLTFTKGTNNVFIGNTLSVGANTIANLTGIFLGNSTVNSLANSTAIQVLNSTATVGLSTAGLSAGANTVANLTGVFLGNSTVNSYANSIQHGIVNSTANLIATPISVTVQNSTAAVVSNSTGHFSGANVVANLTAVAIQNSTVNSVLLITGLTTQNSTAAVVTNSTGFFAGANTVANLTAVQSPILTATSNLTTNTLTVNTIVAAGSPINLAANATYLFNIIRSDGWALSPVVLWQGVNTTTNSTFNINWQSAIGGFQDTWQYFILDVFCGAASSNLGLQCQLINATGSVISGANYQWVYVWSFTNSTAATSGTSGLLGDTNFPIQDGSQGISNTANSSGVRAQFKIWNPYSANNALFGATGTGYRPYIDFTASFFNSVAAGPETHTGTVRYSSTDVGNISGLHFFFTNTVVTNINCIRRSWTLTGFPTMYTANAGQ